MYRKIKYNLVSNNLLDLQSIYILAFRALYFAETPHVSSTKAFNSICAIALEGGNLN